MPPPSELRVEGDDTALKKVKTTINSKSSATGDE